MAAELHIVTGRETHWCCRTAVTARAVGEQGCSSRHLGKLVSCASNSSPGCRGRIEYVASFRQASRGSFSQRPHAPLSNVPPVQARRAQRVRRARQPGRSLPYTPQAREPFRQGAPVSGPRLPFRDAPERSVPPPRNTSLQRTTYVGRPIGLPPPVAAELHIVRGRWHVSFKSHVRSLAELTFGGSAVVQ